MPAKYLPETAKFAEGFGHRLATARKDRPLPMTQVALATHCHVQPAYIFDLEHGRRLPSLLMLRRLCRALGVSADALLDTLGE